MKYLKFLLIINSIFLCLNIIILLRKKSYLIKFKNIDYKFLNYNRLSYKNISNYLNSKYIPKLNNNAIKKDINKNKDITKKKIKLYFIDFKHSSYRKKQIMKIKEILNQKFEVSINKKNPDYLIFNVFGCEHINNKYNKAIKIAYYTENHLPDFSIADYVVGQSNINYLDRYLKIPYLIGYYDIINNSNFTLKRKLAIKNLNNKKFCAAVISNHRKYSRFRLKFIKELDKYKKVDMGGRYNNNVGKIKDKILFLSSYKFSISMENSEGDGYLSEKIIDSFLAGTIPIYYGNYIVDEYINPKSYILIRGEEDMKEKINYIKKIDTDNDLYIKLMNENIVFF